MRWTTPLFTAAISMVSAVDPVHAQVLASFRGTVQDSATAAPVRRAVLWLNDRYPVRGTKDGRLAADSIPAGAYRLRIACAKASNEWGGHVLADENVVLAPGEELRRDIVANASRCDQRPYLNTIGTFAGFFQFGFEHSRYLPCPTVPRRDSVASALADTSEWIWVKLAPRAEAQMQNAPRSANRRMYHEWFVEWRGRFVGPDRYGHLGVSEYQAEVDSIVSMRKPRRRDCKRRS